MQRVVLPFPPLTIEVLATAAGTMSSSKPKVIACGHRQIQTKSGKSFPAFLIRCGESDHRYFWRSKRDFLVLNRATEHSFPKKAFAKLSDQAQNSGSWVRPDDVEAPSGGYCKLVGDHSVSDNIIERNFNPNMKKSLLQLDEFLLKASSASKEISSDNDGDDNDSITKAWNVFCKPEHTNHLTDSSNSTNNLKTHTSTAAKLGQYFASDDNARLVIRKLIELLERDSESSTSGSLVFVEPSCGDGRIISELLNATKHLKADNIKILGYDIDPTAIERAKANLSGNEVALECKDFLSLSFRDLLSAISSTSSTTPEEQTSSRKRRRADDDNGKVIVVGGPPYTPKPLPQQFILHSIQQLKAEIVVFILPERCKKDADHLQQTLNNTTDEATRKWTYSNIELENIDFSFEQSTIQQPSVLQCWYQM